MRILVLLIGIFVSGCSVLAPQEDKLVREVSNSIETLCKEIDKTNRDRFLEKVNADLSGQMVLVDCGGN
jgi:hypothetical protein